MRKSPISPKNPINKIAPPPVLDDSEKPVVPRVRTPQDVRNIHKRHWDDDINNRRTRAQVQLLLDNDPPFNQAKLDAAGLGGCSNVSSGYGRQAIYRKLQPYIQTLRTLRTYLKIKTKHGSPEERRRWNAIMSKNHRKMLRKWRPFTFRYLLKALFCVSHGSAFAYWPDDSDWRWNVSSTGDMVTDRMAKADTTEFQIVSTEVDFTLSEMWSHIKDLGEKEEWSKKEYGWFAPMVRATMNAATGKDMFKSGDQELAVRRIKNLEVVDYNDDKVCTCIIMWVTETDGTITQLIVPKKPADDKKRRRRDEEEQFLFYQSGFFHSLEEGLITFTRDIGTNGYFHSIRGTGANIYASARRQDLLKCRMDDAITMEMSTMCRATDDVLMTGTPFAFVGPLCIVDPGIEPIKDQRSTNYLHNAIPAMQMFRQDWMEQQGAWNNGNLATGDSEFGEDIGMFDGSSSDVMEYSLWHESWERLLVESMKRVHKLYTSGTESMPGGRLAWQFKKWCMEEGVPIEALEKIDFDECEATMPIGNGSPQARLYSMERMLPLAASTDENGRNSIYRDYTSSLPGMDLSHADEYFPEVPDMRPSQEWRNAMYENNFLVQGGTAQLLPNDNHIIHLQQHTVPMLEIQQMVESGEITQAQAVQPLYPLYLHASEHLEAAYADKIMAHQVSEFSKVLHNLGEIITNGQRELQAQQRKAMKAGANGQNGANGNGAEAPQTTINTPREQFGGLSAAEFSLLAKTQESIRSAQRSAMEREALLQRRTEIMERDSQNKARMAKAKIQMEDYRNAVAATALMQRTKAAIANSRSSKRPTTTKRR